MSACPSCDRDLTYPGQPGHECYTYAERQLRVKLARVEALAEDWLTPREDYLGRPRSWWDEKPYGEELRAALDEGTK